MKKKTILLIALILLLMHLSSFSQKKTILVFDLENHQTDSLTLAAFDTATTADKTKFYIGSHNSATETLEQTAPFFNIYPGSSFTRKRKASLDYDLTKFPLRTSIKMFYRNNDTLHDLCSGSMVSRRHVLTAAHCVTGINSNVLSYDSVYVCPAFDNGQPSSTFPCSWVEKIYIFKGWSMNGDDFALLRLKEPVGDVTGWISIGFEASDSTLKEGIYYKFSYPAITNLFIDSTTYNGDTMFYNYGKISLVSNNWIGVENARANQGESGRSGKNYLTFAISVMRPGLFSMAFPTTIRSAPALKADLAISGPVIPPPMISGSVMEFFTCCIIERGTGLEAPLPASI